MVALIARIDIRIVVGVVRKLGGGFDVLVFTVFADPLVALDPVLLTQRLRIEVEVRKQVVQSLSFCRHRLQSASQVVRIGGR